MSSIALQKRGVVNRRVDRIVLQNGLYAPMLAHGREPVGPVVFPSDEVLDIVR